MDSNEKLEILNGLQLGRDTLMLAILELSEDSAKRKPGESKWSILECMEHIAIDTDELDNVVEKLKARGINILEQTMISGGRRVCFFEGPDGVQLEFIEMKS